MESNQTTKVVLFDLHNTLFDHYHTLRSAIAIIQKKYASFANNKLENLIARYNTALQRAYDKYLCKEITYEEADVMKVQLFFTELALPEPSLEEIREFRAVYKQAHRENRRATPGSVETLVRLREHGFRLAILSNGQIEDQTAKVEVIGVRHLVDHILTLEEGGYCKPDPRIFQFAIETINSFPYMVYMVGDSIDSDIKGALDAGLSAILYSPTSRESHCLLSGKEVPVIGHMGQLLEHMGITNPRFEPRFISEPGQLHIEGIGIDLVTELRHCLHISKETVASLAENIGQVLGSVSEKRYTSAISRLEKMIRTIAKAAMPIDETALQISYPGQDEGCVLVAQPECHFIIRDSSVRAEYMRLTLATDFENEAAVRGVAILLQSHCNNLMRDYPRAALRDLRSAMLTLAELAGVKSDLIIRGEEIDK